MAKPALPLQSPPRTTPERAIVRIESLIAKLEAIDPLEISSLAHDPQIIGIREGIKSVMADAFSENSQDCIRFRDAANFRRSGKIAMYGSRTRSDHQRDFAAGRQANIALLKAAIETLKHRIDDDDETNASISQQPPEDTDRTRVFIVHGHDEAALQSVARFIEYLELVPIVLREQTGQGRTIIEKIEDYSEVGFAVVLLTPDDQCGSNFRARQNVILELGYFIGLLSRKRVCVLKKGDIELPSDTLGIEWVPLDEYDGWRYKLAKELKAAGYSVELKL